jgi:hypothetical protein
LGFRAGCALKATRLLSPKGKLGLTAGSTLWGREETKGGTGSTCLGPLV